MNQYEKAVKALLTRLNINYSTMKKYETAGDREVYLMFKGAYITIRELLINQFGVNLQLINDNYVIL